MLLRLEPPTTFHPSTSNLIPHLILHLRSAQRRIVDFLSCPLSYQHDNFFASLTSSGVFSLESCWQSHRNDRLRKYITRTDSSSFRCDYSTLVNAASSSAAFYRKTLKPCTFIRTRKIVNRFSNSQIYLSTWSGRRAVSISTLSNASGKTNELLQTTFFFRFVERLNLWTAHKSLFNVLFENVL